MSSQVDNLNTPSLDTRINPRQKMANIYETSLAMFEDVLKHVWGADVPVAWVGAAEDLRTVFRQEGKISFPFFALRAEQIEITPQSYHALEAARRGIKLKMSSDGQRVVKLSFKPITAHVSVEFVTNNMANIHKFCETYLYRCRKMTFDMLIDGPNNPAINIQVLPDESVSIDQANYDSEDGKMFTASVQVQIKTYAGVIYSTPTIETIKITGFAAQWDSAEVTNTHPISEYEVFTLPVEIDPDSIKPMG